MLGSLFSVLFLFFNPPAAPPPGDGNVDSPFPTAEAAADYEAAYNACAWTFDPEGCRADLAAQYGL